jgi:hypothetical protein
MTASGAMQAPLWAFVAEAVDGIGDSHLPKGIHVRALPSPRLGLPATPLVVTRAVLTPDFVRRNARQDVVWVDSQGTTLTTPFDVVPGNPVYGYFPVPDVIWAELAATPAPAGPVIRPPIAIHATEPAVAPTVLTHPSAPLTTPTPAPTPETPAATPAGTLADIGALLRPVTPIRVDPGVTSHVDLSKLQAALDAGALRWWPPLQAGSITFEAVTNSPLGPVAFQARNTAPYALAAWQLQLVRISGRGTVNGIRWLDAARVKDDQEQLWEIWSLPVKKAGPRYTPTPDAVHEAAQRVEGAAATRLPLYVANTATAPATAPPATPADATARVDQVRPHLDRWVDALLTDLAHPTWEVTDTQGISGTDGSVAVPIEPFLISSAVDPDVGHHLGFGDVDPGIDAPAQSLVLYRIRGLWRWQRDRWNGAEAQAFAEAVRTDRKDSIRNFEALEKFGIVPQDEGPFVDLRASAVALTGVPPSPPGPVTFVTTEDRGWLASPPPPDVRRAVRLVADGFLPHPVAALGATDSRGDRSLNPYPGVGRLLPGLPVPTATPLPIVVSRPGDATVPGQGRFEDRDAPEGAVLYRLAQGDWFGRWGPWRTTTAPTKARTAPMRPTIELIPEPPSFSQPAPITPLTGTIQVRIPIPGTQDLPPGGAALDRLELDETFAGSATTTTGYALGSLTGATVDTDPTTGRQVLVISRTGPSLEPSESRLVTYTARWIDVLPLMSADADPASRTIVDPRPPALPPVETRLRYTARPDAAGHARVDLDFATIPGVRYRVYASTETTLLKALDSGGQTAAAADIRSAEPGAPRAGKFRDHKTLFGWDHFECLTKEPIVATASTTHFVHRVSGSLDVLAIYRVISEGTSGALADLTQADLVPFAVPNLGGPPRPQVAVVNAGLDPTTQGVHLRVKVPVGKATPLNWRLRRASVPTNDPLRMQVVAEGPVGATIHAGEGDTFEIVASEPLHAWRQYRFSVQVQADDPPGAPTVGVVLPGEWSDASAPATLAVIPPLAPAAPTGVQIANVSGDLEITVDHPAADTLLSTPMGQHRFDVWRIEPGGRPRRSDLLFTRQTTGHWVASDAGNGPAGTYVTVRVIDPLGRRGDATASNQI